MERMSSADCRRPFGTDGASPLGSMPLPSAVNSVIQLTGDHDGDELPSSTDRACRHCRSVHCPFLLTLTPIPSNFLGIHSFHVWNESDHILLTDEPLKIIARLVSLFGCSSSHDRNEYGRILLDGEWWISH
jgi:hypothetical protein